MPLGHRPILLLLDGDIHTMDVIQPRAQALAIDRGSGRILAVGDNADIRALAGPLTETLDLRGRVVIPGLIDAHTHLAMYAQARLNIDLSQTRSEDEAVALARQRASQTPPGAWVIGQRWDRNHWSPANFPTKASLDAAIPDHPVALSSHDYHSIWVNSLALQRAGIDATTPDPPSGKIVRDAAGEPTGLFFEGGALGLIEAAITPPDTQTLLAELRAVLADLRARGVTGVHNIEDESSLRLMQALHASGDLSPRVLFFVQRQALPDAVRLGIQADFGDDLLRFAGIKVFMDGALGSQTAAMIDPYEGRPDYTGLLTTSDTEVLTLANQAAEGGLGIAIHAIGDRAVRAALDGIEGALHQQEHTRHEAQRPLTAASLASRYRLEHTQLIRPEDITRMARLDVVGSVQPFHAVVDRYTAERAWGTRHARSYAYQTMRAAGVRLALGSDVPVDTADPWRILHAAVTRRNDQAIAAEGPWLPDQALSLDQAFWGYTVGAAYAGGQETRQGSLTPGKLADLVVLADNIFTVPADRLASTQVAATLVGGELVSGKLD